MAKTKVNKHILYHNGVSYQISQIISKKIVHITLKVDQQSRRPKKPWYQLWAVGVVFIISLISLLFSLQRGAVYLYLSYFFTSVTAIYYLSLVIHNVRSRKYNKKLDAQKDKHMYALSLRLANGDEPLFVSDNLDEVREVDEGIEDAMNDKTPSVSIKDSKIDIRDSSDISIGEVIQNG